MQKEHISAHKHLIPAKHPFCAARKSWPPVHHKPWQENLFIGMIHVFQYMGIHYWSGWHRQNTSGISFRLCRMPTRIEDPVHEGMSSGIDSQQPDVPERPIPALTALLFFDLIDRHSNQKGRFILIVHQQQEPCSPALDRIFDDPTVLKLRSESFRGKWKNAEEFSLQTVKIPAVEPIMAKA